MQVNTTGAGDLLHINQRNFKIFDKNNIFLFIAYLFFYCALYFEKFSLYALESFIFRLLKYVLLN